jgi:hypothetical protein
VENRAEGHADGINGYRNLIAIPCDAATTRAHANLAKRAQSEWVSPIDRIIADIGVEIGAALITDWIGLNEPAKTWI